MTPFHAAVAERFAVLMVPVRARGWWVELDVRETGAATICATFLGKSDRVYSVGVPPQQPAAAWLYERWFRTCACLLEQALDWPPPQACLPGPEGFTCQGVTTQKAPVTLELLVGLGELPILRRT